MPEEDTIKYRTYRSLIERSTNPIDTTHHRTAKFLSIIADWLIEKGNFTEEEIEEMLDEACR